MHTPEVCPVQGSHGITNSIKDRNPFTPRSMHQGPLLRFDPHEAEIWLDGSSVMAGIKMLLGFDPKDEYKDNVAKVEL